MGTPAFDPRCLTPDTASLNRIVIAELPGAPPDVLGKNGYELLGVAALCQQMRARADELALSPHELAAPERDWPPALNARLGAADASVQAVARDILRVFGRRLGCLLRALRRADPATRAARPTWDSAAWDYWRAVTHVTLGGGLTMGELGRHLAEDTAAVFTEAGETPPALLRSPYGSLLPMVGAGRCAPPGTGTALALDFGSSFVKRAVVVYEDGALAALRLLPAAPTISLHEEMNQRLFDFMLELMGASWQLHRFMQGTPAGNILVSLAAYIDRDGQPYERQGGPYAALRNLSPNVTQAFSQAVSRAQAYDIQVRLLHDGTAAACAHNAGEHAATIMLGTALGVGYQPPYALLPVAQPLVSIIA